MKTLVVFPIFILFIFAIFSTAMAGNNNITGSGTQGYGSSYYILPNGTYVYSNGGSLGVVNKAEVVSVSNNGNILLANSTTFDSSNSIEFYNWGWEVMNNNQYSLSYATYLNQLFAQNNNILDFGIQLNTGNNVNAFGTAGFSATLQAGIISAIIAAMGIAAIMGFRVLGSGEGDFPVETATKGTFYLILWGILSVFAYTLISSVFIIGSFIYLGLTIMYVMGFIQGLHSEGGD